MAVSAAAVRTGRRTRRFYVGMAIAIAITVFAGFSRSYFLKAWYGTPELGRLLHVHGLVFTTWVLFFLAQTTLVASGKTYLHRRMGIGGAVLAALVLIVGTTVAIMRVKSGKPSPIPGVPALSFLAIPLFDMIVFAILVGSALYFRRRLEAHKRLDDSGDDLAPGCPYRADPFSAPAAGPADVLRPGRPLHRCIAGVRPGHPKKVTPRHDLGRLLIVASQPLRLMIAGTPAWMAFAGWLTR